MERYNVTAEMYDCRYADEQKAKYKAALANVNVAGSVLDVGCGTGLLFNHVATLAETVVGVDVSGKVLREAKDRAKNLGNIHLLNADADHLPIKDHCCMVVFAFTLLQNMPKPAKTLRELRRAAKRGGLVVVSGLKKTFSLEAFKALLKKTDLHVDFCENDGRLKGYVAISAQSS